VGNIGERTASTPRAFNSLYGFDPAHRITQDHSDQPCLRKLTLWRSEKPTIPNESAFLKRKSGWIIEPEIENVQLSAVNNGFGIFPYLKH